MPRGSGSDAGAVSAEACPIYDTTGIPFAVQEAVSKFQGPWLARLGRGTYEGFQKEHWASIKALSRRIAGDEETAVAGITDLESKDLPNLPCYKADATVVYPYTASQIGKKLNIPYQDVVYFLARSGLDWIARPSLPV